MSENSRSKDLVRPRPFWRGLAFRVIIALSLPLTLIMTLAGWFNIGQQRDHLERQHLVSATRCADTIRRSTRDAMLLNRADQLNRILRDIGLQKGIESIRIFDRQGVVKRATNPADLLRRIDETTLGLGAEPAEVTHFGRDGNGDRVLSIVLPVENEADCAACHQPVAEEPCLGGLEVRFPLKAIDEQIVESEYGLGLGLLGTLLAAVGAVGLLMWRLVIRPVKQLQVAADQVAAGDFQARMPVVSSDEMGEMAERWNNMVDELSMTRTALERLNEDLEARVALKTQELHDAYRRMIMVEKMASLGKLSAVVAHEINNPLAGITTYARLLRRRAEKKAEEEGNDGENARILKMVEEESARCGRIVQNLLLFSRAPTAHFAERDLRPILERCALLVHHKAELQDVEVDLQVPESLPNVVCDAAQIQQVIIDITMNAIEAMPDGGRLRLGVAEGQDEDVVVTIADTGVGIPPDIIEQIFEPFFTTKSEGHGVGLGLAVAYGIVERHGGRIEVASTVGQGTTFTIHLPLEAQTGKRSLEDSLTGAER